VYIIVGLGNPGKKYEFTRHNVGFDAIDRLAEKHGIAVTKMKYKALIGECNIAGEKVILVKPQTYMNLSGETVMNICQFYQLPMEKLIVIYDDIDTDFAKLRIRMKGSAGTHNGMRHIIYLLQKDDFPRIRIGIGKSDRLALKDYVLQKFNKEEMVTISETIDRAAQAAETIISSGIEIAMNRYNG
jgi:peptidyl-tRNA hydrolase, PTH1 family